MAYHVRILLGLLLTVAALCGVGAAQARKVGNTLVYELTIRGGQAGPPSTGLNGPMTLSIDRVDADGSAHANVAMKVAGTSVSFEATISPAGEITPKYDPNLRPGAGMTPESIKSMTENFLAESIALNIRAFNDFAAACASHALKDGGTWQAASSGVPLTYSVTGHEQRLGRNVATVVAKTMPGASAGMSATGYYDTVAHLVVSFHADEGSGGQMESIDMALQP